MATRGFMRVIGRLQCYRQRRCLVLSMQKKNLSSSGKPPNLDEPIKYSATKASRMDTSDTLRLKPNPAVLPIERFIILITTVICLIYFAILRVPNKIDKVLDGSFDYPEDDEIKILNALLHAKLKGLNTDDLEKKLQLIRQQNK